MGLPPSLMAWRGRDGLYKIQNNASMPAFGAHGGDPIV